MLEIRTLDPQHCRRRRNHGDTAAVHLIKYNTISLSILTFNLSILPCDLSILLFNSALYLLTISDCLEQILCKLGIRQCFYAS